MAEKTLAERINDMEMDHVFTLHFDGSITHPKEIWAPEVYHSDENDIDICDDARCRWRAMIGFTGQYGYHGAVMHQSEYIGTYLAEAMLQMVRDGGEPLDFVVTTVECLPEDEEDDDPFPTGWVILYHERTS